MNKDFYKKLVDLYAGEELSEELESELEDAAMADPELSHDMFTLRRTVETLKENDDMEYTEESHQRILMKLAQKGGPTETRAPESAHWQYHLPIQG
jgi:hypothetical protein